MRKTLKFGLQICSLFFVTSFYAQNFSYGSCKYGFNNYGNNDCALLSISINTINNNILVYPNPTSENLFIEIKNKDFFGVDYNVKIVNNLGQILYDNRINLIENQRIDVSNLDAGNYFIIFYNKFVKFQKQLLLN
jgi:Secretion system C-terminal sorting domain